MTGMKRRRHKPGESHHYRIECDVCGQQGQLVVSIEPQREDPPVPAPDPTPVLADTAPGELMEAWGK